MTTTDTVETTEPTPEPKRRRTLPVLAVLVLLAVTAAVAVLHARQDSAARVEAARAEATRAAGERISAILSYAHDTLDRDLAAAERSVTGGFARDYLELQRTMIRPAAVRDRISTRTTLSALGVVRGDDQQVVVLAFINQLTTSSRQTTPLIEGARVRVTLEQVGEEWRVSKMDTV
ncbi:hypothetical protein EIL87_06760 [Saccharopolyspora rhizosphaerae]|uniref:Mce-associated membrane protein n=1 Tax=Saccharopolyspora rhizosphaerae TaxID=2492662 RepID=A0A3R8P7G1_9PSEU|nr:hypothetical protein [Saccharopolyspora rhizosphaerae]RRO17965.1 hypothetical protein EIL87_06760 [Saccharopolyspora rhizosphaerae]